MLDSTLLLNQDMIQELVASHPFISIINMIDTYEQMRVVPEDMPKTLFSSLLGTYASKGIATGHHHGKDS